MAEQLSLPLELTDTLKTPTEMVEEFMVAFDASKDPDLWIKLIREETDEFLEAFNAIPTDVPVSPEQAAAVLKEAVDVGYVYLGFISTVGIDKAFDVLPVELYDRVVTVRDIMALTIPYEKFAIAFHRVHRSNMSKLGDDGKPVRREDGKILKGPNYAPPRLIDLCTKVN